MKISVFESPSTGGRIGRQVPDGSSDEGRDSGRWRWCDGVGHGADCVAVIVLLLDLKMVTI